MSRPKTNTADTTIFMQNKTGTTCFNICAFFSAHTVHTYNINGRDLQRKNVVNNVDKSSLSAPWQNGPYRKHTEHQRTEHNKTRSIQRHNRHLEITICCVFRIFLGFFFNFQFSITWRTSPKNVELPPGYGQWKTLGVKISFPLHQTSHFFNIFWRRKRKKVSIHSS